MKKILSVFLAVLMIAGCMAISFSASAEDITINITVKEPKVGETPDTNTITISPTKYAKYFQSFWYATSGTAEVTTPFAVGKQYEVRMNFNYSRADDNDDDYEQLYYHAKYTINGKEATSERIMDGAVLVTYTFDALPAPDINITITEPKAGETTDKATISVTPVKYAKYVAVSYNQGSDEVTAFEAGKQYYAHIEINATSSDDFDAISNATYTVNGKAVQRELVDGVAIINFYFDKLPDADTTPTDPEPQQSVCPWCGGQHEGFFQKIIGFFHNILAKIFGAKY